MQHNQTLLKDVMTMLSDLVSDLRYTIKFSVLLLSLSYIF